MQTKYIFMTGGVCSGLGKGITAASLGRLLKARGYRVTIQKFDPYINRNPGLLSPYQHGEVYVTDDGTEVDLDLGHYERYIDESLTRQNSVTTGKIYAQVLEAEENGVYKGTTIQIIPHITNAIKEHIVFDHNTDVVISEIGGTVGDIESLPYIEAIRQFADDIGAEHAMFVHVILVPFLSFAGEAKTKPSQHSVKELRSLGIRPDVLVCRTEKPLGDDLREKIARFCHVKLENVIENRNAECLYELPLMLEREGFAEIVCKRLGLEQRTPDLADWTALIKTKRTGTLTIGVAAKYVESTDAYISMNEALKHAGIALGMNVEAKLIDAEQINDANVADLFNGVNGILLPAGFGKRGAGGLVSTAKYARENKIPLLAIGQGMHCALVEFARNVVCYYEADSAEFNPNSPDLVVVQTKHDEEHKPIRPMRKGAKSVVLTPGSHLANAYETGLIRERFRHLFQINNQCRKPLMENGLLLVGHSPDDTHCEAFELPRDVHPWYVGVQFCPEFKSRINKPSPLYVAFLKNC